MSIPYKLQAILDDFAAIADRDERTEMLIQYADAFQEVPERIAARPYPEDHRVEYCESEAYVWAEPNPDGTLKFYFAVENPQGISARALATILDQTLSGTLVEEAAAITPDMVHTLFGGEISMGKGRGLAGIVAMVKNLAQQHQKLRTG